MPGGLLEQARDETRDAEHGQREHVRSDGIILVPGNREDLITWALDPKMSGDTLGLLLPTLFVIVGAQLKQVAGVPEYVSGAVGITTKLIATGLVALYWLPDFTAGLK